MATYHVLPIDDLKPHEESTTCECEPRCEWQPNGDLIVVHSAWDGREAIEEFNEIMQSLNEKK